MKQSFTTALIAATTAVIVVVLGFALVSNNQPNPLGASGMTRMPNSGFAARCFTTSPTSSATCADGSAAFSGNLSVSGTETITGVATFSGDVRIASSTATGTSTINSTILIGTGSSTVQCIQMYSKSTSTLFYIGVNTSTGALFATSTKPTNLCN